jgi:hypothetical protein
VDFTAPTNTNFYDTDVILGKIGGVVTWTGGKAADITGYRVYLSVGERNRWEIFLSIQFEIKPIELLKLLFPIELICANWLLDPEQLLLAKFRLPQHLWQFQTTLCLPQLRI